jgi:hypothetical protein
MNSLRQFVIDKKIGAAPSDDKAVLKETPRSSWNAASRRALAPFETRGDNRPITHHPP